MVPYQSQMPETSKAFVHQWYFPVWKPATTTNNHRLTAFITRFRFCCQTIGRRFGTKPESCSGFIGQKDQLFHPSQRGDLAWHLLRRQRRRWTKCWNARSQERTNTIIWRNQSCFQREKGRNHHLKAPLLSRNVVRFPEEPHGVWIPRPRKIGEPSSSVTHVLQKVQPRAAREMIYILALLYTPGLPKIWENWI